MAMQDRKVVYILMCHNDHFFDFGQHQKDKKDKARMSNLTKMHFFIIFFFN